MTARFGRAQARALCLAVIGLFVGAAARADGNSPPAAASSDFVVSLGLSLGPVRAAIEQDPSVQQAARLRQAADHGAAMSATGPYEWTVGATTQRRRTDGVGSATEWSVQIDRPLRVAGKAGLDRQLGQSGLVLAQAQLDSARLDAARRLLDTWLDLRAATQARALMDEQVQAAEDTLRAVALRQKAGEASRLAVNVAEGDLAQVRQQAAAAATTQARAQAAWRIRFPALAASVTADAALPTPTVWPEAVADRALATGEAAWRAGLVDAHPLTRAAAQAAQRAQLAAERARADRTPDPTLGVFTASEAARTEHVVGLRISIPLGGSHREQAELEALRLADAARAGLDRQRQELDLALAEQQQEARGSVERWRLAEQAAVAAAETWRLTRKAYAVGEADVQGLLMVRRQALEASSAAQAARIEALRAQGRLRIDAGQLWAEPAP